MNILIVNDDGYFANGIVAIAKALAVNNNVTVIAPNKCYSGCSHSATFYKPITIKKIMSYKWECYSVEGTPIDCVMYGVKHQLLNQVDLIISGINNVYNVGTDVIYSGTANAAIEGAMLGIKSIAISTETEDFEEFEDVANYFVNYFEYFISIASIKYPININIKANKSERLSIKITQLGKNKFNDNYILEYNQDFSVKRATLVGEPILDVGNVSDCDVELLRKGHTTVTPISLDWNNFVAIKAIKDKII